jgi:hypothetical protein
MKDVLTDVEATELQWDVSPALASILTDSVNDFVVWGGHDSF